MDGIWLELRDWTRAEATGGSLRWRPLLLRIKLSILDDEAWDRYQSQSLLQSLAGTKNRVYKPFLSQWALSAWQYCESSVPKPFSKNLELLIPTVPVLQWKHASVCIPTHEKHWEFRYHQIEDEILRIQALKWNGFERELWIRIIGKLPSAFCWYI